MNWKPKKIMAWVGAASLLISAQNAWALSAVLVKDAATWSDPTAWVIGTVPGSSDKVYVREDYSVTVDSDVGTVSAMYIGDLSTYASRGTVNIVDGGSLTANATEVGRIKDTGYGVLNISGGYFQSGDSSGSGAVFVGIDNATVETTGIITISGTGAFVGRAIIGSTGFGASGDVLRIIGSDATVGTTSTAGSNSYDVRESGSVEWVFDATGVSTVNAQEVFTVAAGSVGLVVDGAAYTGGDQTFTLLSAGTISSTPPSITLNNFEEGTTYSWNSTTDTFTINVKRPIVRSLRFLLVK